MRPNLRIITEHRPLRARGARDVTQGRRRIARNTQASPACEGQEQHEAVAESGGPPLTDMPVGDTALRRARGAGGPLDTASYTCQCGYVFAASVSTTVSCPRCGAPQAW